MDRIVKTVNGLKNIGSYKSRIEVSPWDDSLDRDRILLLDHDSHCYVICYLSGQSLGYIADGTNNYMNDGTVREEIAKFTGLKLVGLNYNQQFRVDHCASSAVMIALELIRHHKQGQWPESLAAPRSLRSRIEKRFHKFESESVSEQPLHTKRRWRICSKCSKHFPNTKRRAFIMHQRSCRAN